RALARAVYASPGRSPARTQDSLPLLARHYGAGFAPTGPLRKVYSMLLTSLSSLPSLRWTQDQLDQFPAVVTESAFDIVHESVVVTFLRVQFAGLVLDVVAVPIGNRVGSALKCEARCITVFLSNGGDD